MKSIILTLISLLVGFSPLAAQDQLLLEEDFNDGFPIGWQSNPIQANNQWFTTLNNGDNLNGSDMMMIEAFPNQPSITELRLPSLPAAEAGINSVFIAFKYNQLAENNSQLKLIQFDDQNPNVAIELDQLSLTSCDPIQVWSCSPDYFEAVFELPNYDHNDQFALVWESFSNMGDDFMALDEVVVVGFTESCPLALNVLINNAPICEGGLGTVVLEADFGMPPYSYEMDFGMQQASPQFSPTPGLHTFAVQDATLCQKFINVTVPNATGYSIQITSAGPSCNGEANGQITATGDGGLPPYNYSINGSPFHANNSFTNLLAGDYIITVIDQLGCIEELTITLIDPAALLFNHAIGSPSCFNGMDGAIAGAGANGTPPYQYSLNSAPFQANGNFTGLAPGVYVVTVKDATNCEKDFILTVPQTAEMDIDFVHTGLLICNGDTDGILSVNMVNNGLAPFSYKLNGVAGGPDWNNLAAGDYVLEVKDANPCTKTVNFTIQEPPPILITAILDHLLCSFSGDGAIDPAVTGGTGPYEVRLDAGPWGAIMQFTDLDAGPYFVHARDANACLKSQVFVLVQPDQLVSDTVSVTASSGSNGAIDVQTSGGTDPYSYNWSNGAFTQDIDNLAPGDYWLLTSDDESCISDTLFVNVPLLTGIDNIITKEIRLLKNPTQNLLPLQLSNYFRLGDQLIYSIINLDGKKITTQKIPITNSKLNLPVHFLENGLYFLSISYKGKSAVKKIIIQN